MSNLVDAVIWFCLGFATCGIINAIYMFYMMEKMLKRLEKAKNP